MLIENSPERICTERYNPYRTNILEAFEIEDGVLELRATTEFTIEKCDGYKLKKCVLTHGFDNGIFFGIDFSKVNIVCGDTYSARKILKKNYAWHDPQWISSEYLMTHLYNNLDE